MTQILLGSCLIIIIVITIQLIRLTRTCKKLTQDYQALTESTERNTQDIAGLCSAAVSVDSRLNKVDKHLDSYHDQLQDIIEKTEQLEHQTPHAPETQPYYSAIQKVNSGADTEELVEQYGLSRDEAMLLIRLHGKAK